MGVDIVGEILTVFKAELQILLPNYSQLDYEYEIENNSERGYEKRFGLIPQGANFADGRAIGSTTMNHIFQLILTDGYQNKDDDTAQGASVSSLYSELHGVLIKMQKKPLPLPTVGHQVLLVSGVSIDLPEFFDDNSVVALRADFNVQYRFKNNF